MNSYNLFNYELEQIIEGNYFGNSGVDHEYNKVRRTISETFGTFQYCVSNYNKVCVSENVFSISECMKLTGGIEGEVLCLTFMNQGRSSFKSSTVDKRYLNNNTYNFFYLNDEKSCETECGKLQHNHLTEIYIDRSFIIDLTEKHPDIFEQMFAKVDRHESFALFEDGRSILWQMHDVLAQIKNANLLGNIAPLMVEAKLLELFSMMLINERHSAKNKINAALRDKMHEAKYIIEKQYSTPPSLYELSRHLGISVTAMKDGFKKVFDTTLYGHLHDYRMKKAENLLITNSDLNIFDVAMKVGYEHQANFSAAFKRKFGVTPREFKKRG
ncbi:AraC family transcriptional regulator [Puteibacter caeruleilacunae]|nr:AraC family transcriptional regulator [Puteibacter caeruleilacunae]